MHNELNGFSDLLYNMTRIYFEEKKADPPILSYQRFRTDEVFIRRGIDPSDSTKYKETEIKNLVSYLKPEISYLNWDKDSNTLICKVSEVQHRLGRGMCEGGQPGTFRVTSRFTLLFENKEEKWCISQVIRMDYQRVKISDSNQ